jgi:hypothetical protein
VGSCNFVQLVSAEGADFGLGREASRWFCVMAERADDLSVEGEGGRLVGLERLPVVVEAQLRP